MMPSLKLYKKDTSAPCHSVFMVLEALNIKDVEYVNVDLQQGEQYKQEYLEMNPQHTVPTLKDGDFVIWDSHAIVTYLVNQYAPDDSLYPKDPRKRALVDQKLHFNNGILFTALREAMIPILYDREKSFRPQIIEKIKSAYHFMEKFLTKTWLTGDKITLADICCVSTISSLNEILAIDVNIYPNLAGWFTICKSKDFYVRGGAPYMKIFQENLRNLLA